jgi:ABC-type taurine transport system ATPase subunit
MLTRIEIRNFKRLSDVAFDLDGTVVLVGPNNTGKTSALQALSLWDFGLRSWLEHYPDSEKVPAKRPGITLNRKDLFAIPTPSIRNLWDGLHVRETERTEGKSSTRNIKMGVTVQGVTNGMAWRCGFEFDYASAETCYCKPLADGDGKLSVPQEAAVCRTAFLPPMSGLSDREFIKQPGEIDTLIGEGQTAQVLRNLCHRLAQAQPDAWQQVCSQIKRLFGISLSAPSAARDRITLGYREVGTASGVDFDISSAGRGLQQTLLLLVFLYAHPGCAILLDEPDAHLECLRQRQVFSLLIETANKQGAQIIAASHSEVVLNEAVERGNVVAFIGQPHRLEKRDQLLKALQNYGFEDYLNAERNGWILYLENYTDLDILKAFAKKLGHPAFGVLDGPVFVRHIGSNVPQQAREHFYALREAKPDFIGIALFDRLDKTLAEGGALRETMWRKREIENYFCSRAVLLAFARELDAAKWNAETEPLLASGAQEEGEECARKMEESIAELETAFVTLGKPSPGSSDIKVTDDFLDPLFANFSKKIGRPLVLRKSDYAKLVAFLPMEAIDAEVGEKLDLIVEVAEKAAASKG